MEELIRKVLSKYNSFVSEAELYEKWLAYRENADMRDALTLQKMKIAMVQSWFKLLNVDEAFVVHKHLIDELEWPRVAFAFSEQWNGEFSRTERTLVKYQASALKKIVKFCEIHNDLIMSLFRDEQKSLISN